ncbi:hypothetical protein [Piscinibacter gummiphilus]|uniref:Uncharacterized protein n=1 Tax=Piscinibacter gummiphilus TaxID=946333 RepID=A0A1W6L577_9BURK|nr:hypothetical protein [Piscinibacter gummiphilus]ARN19356.1 hypothetical protein A4W93_05205 [Piscinibacter gummiphilus]ATU64023.1 hypothetical protein CPZ87_05290 [Piscinibacter gummiphilus]GLS93016.1 hypothetical protein GCM10007918_03070 [Piscinibacter gummiphilus]
MHLFHSRFHRHERHHARGRFGAFWHAAFHHSRPFHDHHAEASFRPGRVPLRSRAAAFLDLDAEQMERMDRLFDEVCTARRAAKDVLRSAEFAALVENENFRREEAQALFDRRIDTLKAIGPSVVAAFGDFFDTLDFEQQQMLRFALRRRRHGHNGRHDAPPAAD